MIGREVAIEARASAFSLESLGICSNFQTEKLLKRYFTRETYFTIRGSQDSNSSLTCLTANWESLWTRSLPADREAASSSPARMTSYLDSLLEALNLSRIPPGLSGCPIDIKRPPIQAVGACFRLGEFCYEVD